MNEKRHIIYRNGIIIRAKSTNRFLCIKKTFTSYFVIYLKGNKKKYPLHWLLYRMSQREKIIIKNIYGITKENYNWVLKSFGITDFDIDKAYEYHHEHEYAAVIILNTFVISSKINQYNYDIEFPKEDRIYPFLMDEFLKRMSVLVFGNNTTKLPNFTYISKVPIVYEQTTIHNTTIKTNYWVYEVEKEFPLIPNDSYTLGETIYTRLWIKESFLEREPHLFPILYLEKTHY